MLTAPTRTTLTVALAAALNAQTFTVDAANGPGANFTSIAAAIASVPDGAVLKIRAGTYARFTITSRSLTLLGEPGVVVDFGIGAAVAINSLRADQSVVLRDMSWGLSLGSAPLECNVNLGRLLFERCQPAFAAGTTLRAVRCAQLHIVDCAFDSSTIPLSLDTCNTTIVRSTQLTRAFSSPGIDLIGGRLDFVGSSASTGVFGSAGIQLSAAAELFVRASSTLAGGTASLTEAISGTGTAVLDPNTNLVWTAAPVAAGVAATFTALASVDASTQPAGGIASATLTRAPGSTEIAALLVGFPGPPITIVPFPEPIWLEPGTAQLLAFAAGDLGASYAVPNAPWIAGVQIAWQGLLIEPTTGLEHATNPVHYVH